MGNKISFGGVEFSQREWDVFRLAVQDRLSNRGIADKLRLEEKSVANYLNTIYSKIGIPETGDKKRSRAITWHEQKLEENRSNIPYRDSAELRAMALSWPKVPDFVSAIQPQISPMYSLLAQGLRPQAQTILNNWLPIIRERYTFERDNKLAIAEETNQVRALFIIGLNSRMACTYSLSSHIGVMTLVQPDFEEVSRLSGEMRDARSQDAGLADTLLTEAKSLHADGNYIARAYGLAVQEAEEVVKTAQDMKSLARSARIYTLGYAYQHDLDNFQIAFETTRVLLEQLSDASLVRGLLEGLARSFAVLGDIDNAKYWIEQSQRHHDRSEKNGNAAPLYTIQIGRDKLDAVWHAPKEKKDKDYAIEGARQALAGPISYARQENYVLNMADKLRIRSWLPK